MQIYGKNFKVFVENEDCEKSIELQMCKKVIIQISNTNSIELFQKKIKVTKNDDITEYPPGEYPQPCDTGTALDNVELFSMGLFMVVRVFDRFDPYNVHFQVSFHFTWAFRKLTYELKFGLPFYIPSQITIKVLMRLHKVPCLLGQNTEGLIA